MSSAGSRGRGEKMAYIANMQPEFPAFEDVRPKFESGEDTPRNLLEPEWIVGPSGRLLLSFDDVVGRRARILIDWAEAHLARASAHRPGN